MTNALWCDLGQHPFPAGQPGSTTLKVTEQVKNQWGGYQPSDTVKDVCRSCAKDYGYSGLVTRDIPDEQLDKQADTSRERTGGIVHSSSDVTMSAVEYDQLMLRMSEAERRLNEVQFKEEDTDDDDLHG